MAKTMNMNGRKRSVFIVIGLQFAADAVSRSVTLGGAFVDVAPATFRKST